MSTLAAMSEKFGAAVLETSEAPDAVAVVDVGMLIGIATWLRDERGYNLPVFATAIDRLGLPERGVDDDADEGRFDVVFQLRSLARRETVRLVIRCPSEPVVPSLSGLWKAFNWLERECYDMYGVKFTGHPDLRRIYMYEQFVGYPLRKDYPKEKRQPLVRREWTDEVTDVSEQ